MKKETTEVTSEFCKTPLVGEITAPSDKSITHRSYIFSCLSPFESVIQNPLIAEDCNATLSAVQLLGCQIIKQKQDQIILRGSGLQSLSPPKENVDCGNSGTLARLICGLVASQDISITLVGDNSLEKRPMGRVILPLEKMGVEFSKPDGTAVSELINPKNSNNKLPLVVRGNDILAPIDYRLPVASAQVKSAIILAALGTRGTSKIIEPEITRNHTENMLISCGASIKIEDLKEGGRTISVTGDNDIAPLNIKVAGDFSSAAFALVAALLIPNSKICIRNVGINQTRSGLLQVLKRMGGNIKIEKTSSQAGEDTADIYASYSELCGITVEKEMAKLMIDEYPILAAAAACAVGDSRFEGLSELRAKEVDRLSAIAEGLKANNVEVEAGEDWLEIAGNKGSIEGGGTIQAEHDHRIAMSFAILGLRAKKAIKITGAESVKTSYPSFFKDMSKLGASFKLS